MMILKAIGLGLLAILLSGISKVIIAQTFEAEKASFSSGLSTQASTAGYSGTGYVGNFANDNDRLTFTFVLDEAGYFDVTLGYLAPYGEKTNIIRINASSREFTVAPSNSFQEKAIGKVRLKKDENVIVISKMWGWFYVDYLRIAVNTDSELSFSLADDLVAPSSSSNTQTLFQFLKDNFQKKIISGVMTLNSFDETNWLKQQTGKEPVLIGLDFMHCNRNYSWYDDSTPITDAKSWYDRNGIPALCWHWRDPSRETEAFYTDKTNFDVSKINDENSEEYQAMISDIDYIALLLKELVKEDIPVLWRPLHEASGGWFWWGAKGPEACKKLWQTMFDRLVNYHQINNLIWVWTTDAREDLLDWYPGDEFVDILGVDIYASQDDFGSQYLSFDQVKAVFEGRKMIALSECGIVPDPDKLVEEEAGWSWFMPWYGDFVRDGKYNPLEHWQKVMDHETVITLDEMPDLRNYATSYLPATTPQEKPFCLSVNQQQVLTISPESMHEAYSVGVFNLLGQCLLIRDEVSGFSQISMAAWQGRFLLVSIKTTESRYSYKFFL